MDINAQTLAAEIEAARTGPEGSPERLYPTAFFNHSVYVIAPTGQRTQVNPRYCARDLATAKLAAVLSQNGLRCEPLNGRGWPDPNGGIIRAGWQYTSKVGWLKLSYPDGALLENAGLVLDFFNHGIIWTAALHNALMDIQWDAFTVGLLPNPPSSEAPSRLELYQIRQRVSVL